MAQERTRLMLLDTNVFVDYLRGYAPAQKFFASLDQERVVFSAISETEIMAGSSNNDEKICEKTLLFLKQWTKLSLNNPVAMFAGELRREHGIQIPDAIIAASARSVNAELITRNTKDFKNIPDLRVKSPY